MSRWAEEYLRTPGAEALTVPEKLALQAELRRREDQEYAAAAQVAALESRVGAAERAARKRTAPSRGPRRSTSAELPDAGYEGSD